MNKSNKKITEAILCGAIIFILSFADQMVKSVVAGNMTPGQTIQFIPGLLRWTYTLNEGASFGILGGQTIMLILIALFGIGMGAFFLIKDKIRHFTGFAAFVLIIGGAIGNLTDRLFNGGLVVDFIDINELFNFAIFNLADCCICVGAVFMVIYVFFFYDKANECPPTHPSFDTQNDEQGD